MSLAGRRVWRFRIILQAILVVVAFGVSYASAQVKTPKRVTSVRAAKAPEGSKVTVVSNSALNDYEAYRQGDRFYVKVPQAGLGATRPKLRGEGFDDVQVQKTGDDIIFSFRLRPGTAARVNQTQNRLDVVFATSPKSPGAAIPRPATVAAPNAASDPAGPHPPATTQAPGTTRGAFDVRERDTSKNSNSKEGITNSALSTGVVGTLEPSITAASTSPSTSAGSQTAGSDKESIAFWSVRRSLSVLVGLLVLGGFALLFGRYKRKDTGWQATGLNIGPIAVIDGKSEKSLENPESLAATPTGVALLPAATSQGSSEIENDLSGEEASLLRQEQALRRQAEALEAKQLAAEKARKEFEASAKLRAELATPADSSLQVTSDPEVVARIQEENRYRRGAETLRKAADEFARMRHAAEAARKGAEQKANPTAEEKTLDEMAKLKMFTKKTASN